MFEDKSLRKKIAQQNDFLEIYICTQRDVIKATEWEINVACIQMSCQNEPLHNAVDIVEAIGFTFKFSELCKIRLTYKFCRLFSLEKISAGRNVILFEDKSLRKKNKMISLS